jgi:hypothetical protein
MTELTIGRIGNHGLFGVRIDVDHIGGTGFNAGPATDASADTFNSHSFFSFLAWCVYFLKRSMYQIGRHPSQKLALKNEIFLCV